MAGLGSGINYVPSDNIPIKSDVNSTETPLAGGATFTGTWEVAPRSMVLAQSYSDVAGTLFFDFSVDGVNADSTFPVGGVTTSASVPAVHPAAVGGRYFRVRYVNGASAQTAFRLGVYYSDYSNFYSPLNQPYNLQSPAILTRPSMPWLDIKRGLATGITETKKFGRNDSVGTTYTPIAFGGVYQTPQAASATALRVKSGGNANDTAAGSGAREITLVGLDENWNEVTDAVATAGASASSATTATFTRLYRAYVSKSGTYATASAGSHSGDIVIENGSGGTDWATIDATNFPKSQTEIGAYSVPTGYTAYVFLDDVTIDTGKTCDLVFFWRDGADDTAAPYSAMRAQTVLTGLTQSGLPDLAGRYVPLGGYIGPCDIGFLGKVDVGTGAIAVEFEIILVQE